MRVVCCQLDIAWEDKAANHARVRSLLRESPPEPGALIVLPEMFATGFSMRAGVISDSESCETQRFLAQLAVEHRSCVVGGVVTTSPDGRGRNQCVVYSPEGEEISRYQKIHPFTHGGESEHYEAGREVQLFRWGGFQVAPFICYDLRFPEIFRSATRRGAEVFTVIANWPIARVHHWVTLLQARAIENQAFVVGVNRAGDDPTLRYPGRTLVVDPGGQIVHDAGEGEGVIHAQLDHAELAAYRDRLPFLADMRPELLR
jgi:omega-amidase